LTQIIFTDTEGEVEKRRNLKTTLGNGRSLCSSAFSHLKTEGTLCDETKVLFMYADKVHPKTQDKGRSSYRPTASQLQTERRYYNK